MAEARQKGIEKALGKLQKNFGDRIFRGDEAMKFSSQIIPSASMAVGDAIGFWGIPKGKITQFYGTEGSGKTFYAMLQVIEAQKDDAGAVQIWIDSEFSFDRTWAAKLGMDMTRVIIVSENNAAEAFAATFGEPGRDGLLQFMVSDDIKVNLIVLDSIASLIPPVEDGRKFSDQNMAALARFLPGALRIALSALNKHNIAMIAINQAREVPGARVPTITCPGGRAYKHLCSVNVQFVTSFAKDSTLFSPDVPDRKIGHKVNLTVEKTRGTVNRAKVELWLDFNVGIAKVEEEIANLALNYGIVKRPSLVRWEWGDVTANGKENFYQILRDTPSLRVKLEKEVRAAHDAGTVSNEIAVPDFEGPSDDADNGDDV